MPCFCSISITSAGMRSTAASSPLCSSGVLLYPAPRPSACSLLLPRRSSASLSSPPPQLITAGQSNNAAEDSPTQRRRRRLGQSAALRGSGRLLGLLSSAEAAAEDANERFKDAAKAGDLETVDRMLQSSNVNLDLPSSKRAGWTALHLASFYDHPSVVRSLIHAGAGLEVRNQSGNTALHLASLKGNIQVAQILLESGSDIHAESTDRGTALDYAQEWGEEDIVDFLLLWVAKKRAEL